MDKELNELASENGQRERLMHEKAKKEILKLFEDVELPGGFIWDNLKKEPRYVPAGFIKKL